MADAMAMISRRKIISRSQSELDYSQGLYDVEEEVWFSRDKLFQVSMSVRDLWSHTFLIKLLSVRERGGRVFRCEM